MAGLERRTPVSGNGTKEHPTHTGRTVGMPDGPPVFRHEFGIWVGSFTMRRPDLEDISVSGTPCLMFHVPHYLRGKYRPHELANFDPDYEYMTDHEGYRICEAETKSGAQCRRRAENRQHLCTSHGARLHPLDKTDNASLVGKDPALMNRFELLQAGYIDVEDLTDDELRTGLAKTIRGQRVTIEKSTYEKIVQRHFQRAQELLAEGLVPAIQALKHISQGTAYEPADRIKASVYIIDRVLGKTPEVVKVGPDTDKEPWQEIVESVMDGGSREESRRARGFVDAEVVAIDGVPVADGDAPEAPGPAGEGHAPQHDLDRQADGQGGPVHDGGAAPQGHDLGGPGADTPRGGLASAGHPAESAARGAAVSSAEAIAEAKAAKKKRYLYRAAGRAQMTEMEPLRSREVPTESGGSRIVFINAEGYEDIVLGAPGEDPVS